MLEEQLIAAARELFREEGRLISLPVGKTVVFVGDTHGDREATERVFSRFLWPDYAIVFLGDYVDRGPDSAGNLELLLQTKISRPDQIFLLQGNHEGWGVMAFSPADFWQSLEPHSERLLADTLSLLPFAAYHPAGVLALHGALPGVEHVDDLERVKLGSADWIKITWGDWADVRGYGLGESFGRPTFGRGYFTEVMERLGLKVLVRSHQPFAPTHLFDSRCLTIFTSNAYGARERQVAVLRPERAIRTARDLELITV